MAGPEDGATDGMSPRLARHHNASPVAPHLRHYVECFLDTFITNGRLDPRLRQLAILRIAWRKNQAYEWANHYRVAKRAGVQDDDIVAARYSSGERDLDPVAAFTLDAVDELIDRGCLAEPVFERAKREFGHPDIAEEFIHLVGGYLSMSALLNTTKPSLTTAGLPTWPPDGVGPTALY